MPAMPKSFEPGPPLMLPYPSVAQWDDFWRHAAEGWFAWQSALWAPLMDGQIEWLRQWSEQTGWPMPLGVLVRGTEQLA